MSDTENVRKFEYRPRRVPGGFKVEFVSNGVSFHGMCSDMSDSGVRAMFDDSLAVGTSGVLSLRHAKGTLQVEAQVSYIDKRQVGLVFLFKTSWERDMTTEFIDSISTLPAVSPIVRFR